jgi:cytochrome c oxidase subunit 1
MAAAVLLATFAAIYYWFPKMFGRMMNEPLGKLHFWLTIVTLNLVFGGQLLIGYAGMQRRLYDPSVYEFLRPLLPLNRGISQAAFVLGAAQLIFVVNFFWSLFRGPVAAANPWQVGTLEWTTSSPPPHHNFDRIPTVLHGPHELSHPRTVKHLHRDWLAQNEPLPADDANPPAPATGQPDDSR